MHFVTNRCNARCSFCFIDFDDPKTFQGELTLEEIEILTKNLGKSLLNVNLTGGEPFIRPDLNQLVKRCVELGVHPRIQTNGLATESALKEVVHHIDFFHTMIF